MTSPRPFKLAAPRASERSEQQALFQFAAVAARRDPRWRFLFAIPNGTAASSMAEAVRAKRSGRKRGVPDVFLPCPVRDAPGAPGGFAGCFLELKRKGGRLSDLSEEQRWWIDHLARNGYKAAVAFGWQEAARILTDYLKTPQPADLAALEGP